MAEHIGRIAEAGMKATKKGQTFHVALEDPKWGYWIFKPEHKKIAEENVGKRVKIVYTESDKGRNVDSIEPVAEAESAAAPAQSRANGYSRDDTRIVRESCLRSAVIFGTNKIMAAAVRGEPAPAIDARSIIQVSLLFESYVLKCIPKEHLSSSGVDVPKTKAK